MIDNIGKLLDLHEGKRNKLYKCSEGHWTIGRGRNLDAKGLSDDEIDYLFENDLRDAARDALAAVPNLLQHNEVRQSVIVDMAFNLGEDGLRGFKNLCRAMAAKNYARAAAEMQDSKWYAQVGGRIPAVERSERLVEMMRSGKWPTK